MEETMSLSEIAFLFEPDGYVLEGPRLMGRQAAGNGFMRALVDHAGDRRLRAYSPHKTSGQKFIEIAKSLDPKCKTGWLPAHRLDKLAQVGSLYLPGPGLDAAAYARLRVGADAYSLIGVTHTTASHGAMDSICSLLNAPVFPWDAVVCTSTAVQETIHPLLEAQTDYLRWRLGARDFSVPQFPLIPLGVHCDDLDFSASDKMAARRDFAIADDEIVALFVGRLSFHAKAHPHAMYTALEQTAQRTGKKIVLLQCGWFANDAIERAFKDGAAQFCPSVRAVWADGRVADTSRKAWAAGDVFVSLSDNIQETFGLTPIEAMAAGLPTVVSDWNGYTDTVRDGFDGFRIPTWMPAAPLGQKHALRHEVGMDNYDEYCGVTCQSVSVDHNALIDALIRLIEDPSLRAEMGLRGKLRARQEFDWPVIIEKYFALWEELAEIRKAHSGATVGSAPRVAPGRRDPFDVFAGYPTTRIDRNTHVVDTKLDRDWQQARAHWLFSYSGADLPDEDIVARLMGALANEAAKTIEALSRETDIALETAISALAWLAKIGCVRFEA